MSMLPRMDDFSSAATARVKHDGNEWRLTVLDASDSKLAEISLPPFSPDHFFVRGTVDQPAGLDHVGPFLNKRGLYYTEWKGRARDGWTTRLHY